ncbi:MAG: oligosaccharide flippase family protein [bacterium]
MRFKEAVNTGQKADETTVADEALNDAQDLAQGALVNYLGMFAKVSKALFVITAARFYGPGELGLYFLAWTAVDIASKFGIWGLDRGLIRDIARHNVHASEQSRATIFGVLRFDFSLAFGLSLITVAVLFSSSTFISLHLFKDANLILPLRTLTFSLPLIVISHMFISMTKALRIMRYDVLIRQTLEPLILLLVALVLIPFELGAVGLAMAQVAASLVAAISAAFAAFKEYRFLGWHTKPIPSSLKKEIIRYASPIAVMDFFYMSAARMDLILVGGLINTAAVGVYGIAVEIISIIKRVRQGFEPIYSPIVSDLYYNRQQERLQRSYVIVTRWIMAGTLLPVVALVLFSRELLSLFSEAAVEASVVLILLACSHGIYGLFNASENLLVMAGKSLLSAVLAAGMFMITIGVSVVLIPIYGMEGAALGMLVAHVSISAVRLLYVYKSFGTHPFDVALIWPVTTAMMTAAMFGLLKFWLHADSVPVTIATLAIMVLTYTAIYFGGAREPEEKHFMAKLKNKLRRTSRAAES